jgi:hypothetical protein
MESAGGDSRGTNGDCIFLGDVLYFGPANAKPAVMTTYPVVGLRQTSAGKEVSSLSEARPSAIAPSTSRPDVPDGTEDRPFRAGITTAWVKYGTTNTDIRAVGFINTFRQYGGSGNVLESGSQQVSLIPISSSNLATSKISLAEIINTKIASSPVDPDGGVKVCLLSGGTNQSGLITIGSNGRQLSVNLVIKENPTCS